MAPDAEKLRQRHPIQKDNDDEPSQTSRPSTTERVCKMNELQSNEVCIDGIIYDIRSFVHPGGESIHLFGGNDVTVQYRMIHPYHTDKHLHKMNRLGKVTDFVCEYKFDTPFEQEIKREVFKIVPRGKEFGTPGWFFRALCYVIFFFYLQYCWVVYGPTWTLAIFYGISKALIGLNVQHDANHGACSKDYPIINELLGLGADFIGGSKWLWQANHWTHHAFTNNHDKDPDSRLAEPMVILHEHASRKWYHKFQSIWFIPILSGYWLASQLNPQILGLNYKRYQVLLYVPILIGNWISSILNPQLLDLQRPGATTFVGDNRMDNEHYRSRRKYAIALRLLYIYTNIVLPLQFHGCTAVMVLLILLMAVAESLALSFIFTVSHNFEQVNCDPIAPFQKTTTNKSMAEDDKQVCWFKSQVETSSSHGGVMTGMLTGGLNFQIEHHLFPRMSSAWYPYIAPTVQKVCRKHNVRYVYFPTIWSNWISTLNYVHQVGTGMNWKKQNPLSGEI